MLHLKDDMDVSSLTFLGTIAHILGPIYLSECFPKVTVYSDILFIEKLNFRLADSILID